MFHPGGISETEILLAYGSGRFASEVGQLAVSHFLTIAEGAERLPEFGRPQRTGVAAAAPADPVTYTAPGRQVAPDDDPEFLGRIASRKRQEDEEMLRLWEADLRKREEELKKREQRPEDDD